MEVHEAIEKRRVYRSLDPFEISDDVIKDLAYHASLAPSCYNKQPWRFIFIRSKDKLSQIFDALPKGNSWAENASMIVAVYSKKEFDCIIGEREYYLFDTGMAVAFLILRATEIGLVAHPIAGYDEDKVKEILGINANLITLIIVGKHSDKISHLLSEWQKEQEIKRLERKGFNEFAKIV